MQVQAFKLAFEDNAFGLFSIARLEKLLFRQRIASERLVQPKCDEARQTYLIYTFRRTREYTKVRSVVGLMFQA